jgi:hypothetical protein
MMARRLTGLPKALRKARVVSYGASRFLGNAQPFCDLLGSGRLDRFALDLGRRYVRRKAGGLYSRASFGRGNIWQAILGLFVNRAVGKIGRW